MSRPKKIPNQEEVLKKRTRGVTLPNMSDASYAAQPVVELISDSDSSDKVSPPKKRTKQGHDLENVIVLDGADDIDSDNGRGDENDGQMSETNSSLSSHWYDSVHEDDELDNDSAIEQSASDAETSDISEDDNDGITGKAAKYRRTKYGDWDSNTGPRKPTTSKEDYINAVEAGLRSIVQYRGIIKPFVKTNIYEIMNIMHNKDCSFMEARKYSRTKSSSDSSSNCDDDTKEVQESLDKASADNDDLDLVQQPSTMSPGCILRTYQVYGVSWLLNQHRKGMNSILADEMGLGKTLQTISFIAHNLHVKKVKGQFLVIVPLSVLPNWIAEFRKWCPSIKTLKVHSNNAKEQKRLRNKMYYVDVVVTTYDTIKAGAMKNYFKRTIWNSVILDEGHRLKNETSALAKACASLRACFKLILTGTPVQNNLHESWALLNFLAPDIFTESKVFDEAFNLNGKKSQQKVDGKTNKDDSCVIIDRDIIAKSHYLLRPFTLRRLKSEVEKSLPPKLETLINCPMTEMQKLWTKGLLYKDKDALENNTSSVNKKGIVANVVKTSRKLAVLLAQLRKAANHPYLFPGCETISMDGLPTEEIVKYSGKMVVLDNLLKKLFAKGHRIVLFSQYTQVLDILDDYLSFRGGKFAQKSRIDGSTNGVMRNVLVSEFNAPNSKQHIFLLTTRAGGEGVNLYSADTVILFDSDWNPQVDNQAMARVHRIGQRKVVHVYRLISSGTVEERIVQRAQKKLFLDGMVNRGSSAIAKGIDDNIADDDGNNQEKEKDISDVLSVLKFGWNSIFSSESEKGTTISDKEIDAIIDRRRGLDANGRLLSDKPKDTTTDSATSDVDKGMDVEVSDGAIVTNSTAFKENVEVTVTDFDESAPFVSIRQFEGELVDKVLPTINSFEKKLKTKYGVSNENILINRRSRESRLVEQEVAGVGKVQVLKKNMYSLEDGEPSVFDKEFKSSKQDSGPMEQIYKVSTGKQIAGRDYANQDHCQQCWSDEGGIFCCDFCPMSFHAKCLHLKGVPSGRYTCPHHYCSVCERTTSEAGMLFRCEQCTHAYCEEHLPKEGTEMLGKCIRLAKLGYTGTSTAYYILCSDVCKENHESIDNSDLSGDDEDDHDEGSAPKSQEHGTENKSQRNKMKKKSEIDAAVTGLKRAEYDHFNQILDAIHAFELHDALPRLNHLKSVNIHLKAKFNNLGSIFRFSNTYENSSKSVRIILRNILNGIMKSFGREFYTDIAPTEITEGELVGQDNVVLSGVDQILKEKQEEEEREILREIAADKDVMNYSGIPLDESLEESLPDMAYNRFDVKVLTATVVTVRMLTSVSSKNLISIAQLLGIVKTRKVVLTQKFSKNLSDFEVRRRTHLSEPMFQNIQNANKRRMLEEVIAIFLVTLLPQNCLYSESAPIPSDPDADKWSLKVQEKYTEVQHLLNVSRLLESNVYGIIDSGNQWFTGQSLEAEPYYGDFFSEKGWTNNFADITESEFFDVMQPAVALRAALNYDKELKECLHLFPRILNQLLEKGRLSQLKDFYKNKILAKKAQRKMDVEENDDSDNAHSKDDESDSDVSFHGSDSDDSDWVRETTKEEREELRKKVQLNKERKKALAEMKKRQDQLALQHANTDEKQKAAEKARLQDNALRKQRQINHDEWMKRQGIAAKLENGIIIANPVLLTPTVDVVNFCAEQRYASSGLNWTTTNLDAKTEWTKRFLAAWEGMSVMDRLGLERDCRAKRAIDETDMAHKYDLAINGDEVVTLDSLHLKHKKVLELEETNGIQIMNILKQEQQQQLKMLKNQHLELLKSTLVPLKDDNLRELNAQIARFQENLNESDKDDAKKLEDLGTDLKSKQQLSDIQKAIREERVKTYQDTVNSGRYQFKALENNVTKKIEKKLAISVATLEAHHKHEILKKSKEITIKKTMTEKTLKLEMIEYQKNMNKQKDINFLFSQRQNGDSFIAAADAAAVAGDVTSEGFDFSQADVNYGYAAFHQSIQYKENVIEKQDIPEVLQDARISEYWRTRLGNKDRIRFITYRVRKDHSLAPDFVNDIIVPPPTHWKYLPFQPFLATNGGIPWTQTEVNNAFNATVIANEQSSGGFSKCVGEWHMLSPNEAAHRIMNSIRAASGRFPLTKDLTKYPIPPQPTVPGYQDEVKKLVSIEGEQNIVAKEAPVVTSAPSLTEVKNPHKGPTTPHTCAIARQNTDPVQRSIARKKILNQDLPNAINFGFAQDYSNEILCSQGGLVDNNRYLVIASKKRQEYPDKNSERALLQYIERDLFLEADSLEQYCDSKSIQQRILATKWYAVLSSVPKGVPMEGDIVNNTVNTAASSTETSPKVIQKQAAASSTETTSKVIQKQAAASSTETTSKVIQKKSASKRIHISNEVVQVDSDDDDLCCICNDGTSEETNLIVFCDACDKAYHQKCHAPILSDDDIAGDFECNPCKANLIKGKEPTLL